MGSDTSLTMTENGGVLLGFDLRKAPQRALTCEFSKPMRGDICIQPVEPRWPYFSWQTLLPCKPPGAEPMMVLASATIRLRIWESPSVEST